MLRIGRFARLIRAAIAALASILLCNGQVAPNRVFCWVKDWRRIAISFDRSTKTCMPTIAIAANVMWWLT
jgi:hypothetical protein